MKPEDVPDELTRTAMEGYYGHAMPVGGFAVLRGEWQRALAAVLPAHEQMMLARIKALADDEPEPEPDEDSCRLVDVDGETVRVRGSGDMDEQTTQALGEVFRAARARMKAEQDAEESAIRADERARVAEEARSAAAAIKADGSRIGGAALAGFAAQLEEGLAARGGA